MGLTKTISFDIDAQRFIFAAGIVNFNQKRAIDYLVKGLKVNGLWAKMAAVYPMVGGIATSCKFNLINPRDSDIAFRLVFTLSPTVTFSGVDWNGTTQWANTFLTPSTTALISLNSEHYSYYSRENTANTNIDIGCNTLTGGALGRTYISIKGQYAINSETTESFSNTNTTGFYTVSRTSSTLTTEYRNGASVSTSTILSSVLPNVPIYIGCRNSGGAIGLCDRQCAFASIGSGLSAADALNMYQIVQQFQIILQRQV